MAITISGVNNNDRIVATDGTIDALSGFNVVGVMTATSFSGDLVGNVTGNVTGNINNTTLLLQTSGTERIRITGNNEIGIAGANYGSAGQVLTSGGSGSAVSWTTINQGVTSDGSYNTVGGTNAGDSIVSGGTHNTVFGHNAGTAISTGDNNTFIGSRAGFNASTGLQNTGVGYNVMGNHGGTGGTALGQNAGNGMGASNYSIALGHSAYSNISANGNNNIVIGYNANVSSSSASNEVTIGNSDINHFRIPGIGVSFSEGGAVISGIVTATNFVKSDGSAVGGIESDAQRNTVGGTNAGDSFSGTDATDNTILGYDAGTSLTTGDKNVIIGAFAAKSLTTVGNVVAIGHSAYSSQVSSNCCSVVIGHNALQTYTGSFGQIAIGKGAGQDAGSSGGNNTLIGENAGYGCKGFSNTIVGYHAGSASNTQGGETIIGHQARYFGNNKAGNTAVGKEAMMGASGGNGSQTTAIGYEALKVLNNGGNQNTALGYQAGDKVNTGTSNVIIGYSAASTGTNDLTNGSNNIIIGNNAAASSATVSNEITFGDSNINHLRVPGIGVTFATNGNHITGITTFSDRIKLGSSGQGQLYYSGGIKMISAAQIELESANQMYIHAQSSGLFLRASNQEVISVYGGSGGGVYFRHNGNQKLKLEGGNWTYQGSATVTFDNHLYIPDSIIHVGDTNTKIRFPENDKISFETNGTERLRIDNVGVLYTGNYTTTLDATPGSIQMSGGTSGARLSLRGTTTSQYGGLGEIHGFWDQNKVASILFHAGADTTNKDDGEIRMYTRTSGGGTAARLVIDSTGNVMINRTSGSKKFSVREGDASSGVYYNAHIGGASHLANYAVGIGFDPEGYEARTKIGIVAEGTGTGYSRGKLHFLLDSANDSGEATLSESRMSIDDAGRVSKPYQPSFQATRAGAGAIQIASNSGADIIFTSEEWDIGSNYNTGNGRFTAPIAGKYFFGTQLYLGFSVTAIRVIHSYFTRNGSVAAKVDLCGGTNSDGGTHYHPTATGTCLLDLSAGDYVTFNIGSPSFSGSGNSYLYNESRFFGYLIG